MGTIGIQESVASEAAVLERPPSAAPAANQIPRDGSPWSPAQVLALQQAGGNAAVGRLLGDRRSLQRACCGSCASGHQCESEEDRDVDDRGRRALSASVVARAAGTRTAARSSRPSSPRQNLQRAPLDIPAPAGECSTRCGGIPVECAPPFCCPFPIGTATAIREAIRDPFLVGIAIKVKASVVPVWEMWFDGGTSLQNFTTRFGADFAADPVTARVAKGLAGRLPAQLDGDKLQALAASSTPGVAVSLLPALPADFLRKTTDALEDKKSSVLMDFDFIGTVPGNLAGGVGKTQRTCQVGAKPSPVDDGRQLSNVLATLVREPNGSITVTPTFRFHVVDTVDLCPGNCGSKLGTINEQLATVPMSRLEASGVSGDVPFTVDFSSAAQASFNVPPPKPPAPLRVTVSGSTLFAFNSDKLEPGGEDAIVAQLGDRPLHADLTQPFVVEGHTDSKGSDAVNDPLSERRARRVAEVLERRYPNLAGHVTSVGLGASRPVAPNTIDGKDNPAGRRLNRRVEIHFTAPPP